MPAFLLPHGFVLVNASSLEPALDGIQRCILQAANHQSANIAYPLLGC